MKTDWEITYLNNNQVAEIHQAALDYFELINWFRKCFGGAYILNVKMQVE